MKGELSVTKQKAYTRKVDEFLSHAFTPKEASYHQPKKGNWYIHKFRRYFAVFNTTNVSRAKEINVEYWMVFPNKTEKVEAVITEISSSVWKLIRKPKDITWDCVSKLWDEQQTES